MGEQLRTWRPLLLGVTAAAAIVGACVCSSPSAPSALVAPDAGDGAVKDVGHDAITETDSEADAPLPPKDATAEEADVDAGQIPPELAWIVDPTLWVELKAADYIKPNGRVYEALHKKLPPLALQWNACGGGCQWADTIQGLGDRSEAALVGVLHGATDEAYLSIRHELPLGSDFVSICRIIRLTDGIMIGAVRRDMSKKVAFSAAEIISASAFTPTIIGGATSLNSDDARQILGRISTDGSPWTWTVPPGPPPLSAVAYFDISYGGGQYFEILPDSVRALQDMHFNQWTTIESTSLAGDRAAGEGDLGGWIDFGGSNPLRLRGWAPDGNAVRTIIDPIPDKTIALGVSPDRIAGIAVTTQIGQVQWGPRAWQSPRAYSAPQSNLQIGPELGESPVALGTDFKPWGDYAAVFAADALVDDAGGTTYGATHILVVHLPTWKTWRLDPAPGRTLRGGYDLNGVYLYTTDAAQGADAHSVGRLYRYELASIAQWAKAL